MISVSVGSETVTLDQFNGGWLLEQLERQTSPRSPACVRVRIGEGDVDVALATPGCGSGQGGARTPRPREKAVLELWHRHGLSEPGWAPGNLIAFLKQLQNII